MLACVALVVSGAWLCEAWASDVGVGFFAGPFGQRPPFFGAGDVVVGFFAGLFGQRPPSFGACNVVVGFFAGPFGHRPPFFGAEDDDAACRPEACRAVAGRLADLGEAVDVPDGPRCAVRVGEAFESPERAPEDANLPGLA